jgi:hypothetical protein
MIPIKRVKGIEAQATFDGISTPNDLANLMTRLLAVDDAGFVSLQEIVVSPNEPTGEEKKKLWIKSSNPPAIGLPIGGVYRMLYQYPPGVPFLWIDGEENLPTYMNKLTKSEMLSYGLPFPTSETIFYVVSRP